MTRVRVLILAPLLASAVAGCTNLERSRDLADPRVPGRVLAQQVCSDCHGADGNSTSPNFPNLAAQTLPYLEEQLRSFRQRSRADPAGFEYMWGLSRSLTDEQIAQLAAYFSQQTARLPGYRSGDPKLVEAGKSIFTDGVPQKNIPACAICHGPQGRGNEKFPRIADQHADYIVKQLTVFQRTDQRPEAEIMKVIAHDLTLTDIRAVASYLETLH